MKKKNTLALVLVIAGLATCTQAIAQRTGIPERVTISLPVAASIEGTTLDPGVYTIVIEKPRGRSANVKIQAKGSSKVIVSAPVTSFQAAKPARRNAVKVTMRKGLYHFDKLVLSGETTGFQFRR